MTKIHLNWIAMVIISVVAFVSCGSTPNAHDSVSSVDSETALLTNSGSDQENSQNSQTLKVPLSASDAPKLAILDDSIPVGYADAYELLHEDINIITEDSGVIFVGRVVDYKERIYTIPPSADKLAVAEPDWMIVGVVEGIVLEADEVLLGEMPEPDSRITLGARTFQETLDGRVKSRLMQREITIFRDGIESIGSDESPQYLVYAVPSNPGGRGASFGLYWINTRSGVLRVGDDGSLAGSRGMPFVEVWLSDGEGNFDWRPAHDLQDARDAAKLAKSGIEDTSGVPEEQSTGIEEAPVDQPVEGSDQGVPVEAPASGPGDDSAGDGSGDLAGVDSSDETSEQTDDAKNGELGDAPDVDDGSEASDDGEGSAPGTSGDVSDQVDTDEAPSPKPSDDSAGDGAGDLAGADSSDETSEQTDDANNGELGDAPDVDDGSEASDNGEGSVPGTSGDVSDQGAPVEDATPNVGDDSAGVVPEGDGNTAEQPESGEDGEDAVPPATDDAQDAQESSGLGS